jgi:hypothetical protein
MTPTDTPRPLSEADSPLYCSAEWHFARMMGRGAALAPLLYNVICRVARDSGNFFVSLTKLAPYFNAVRQTLYNAADLLEAHDWLVPREQPDNDDWIMRGQSALGVPGQYRPVFHKEWADLHPDECCQKLDMPWAVDDVLATRLFGITGGNTFFPNVLRGWRNIGLTDDQIVDAARRFMDTDAAHVHGPEFRKALGEFLRNDQLTVVNTPDGGPVNGG